MKKSKDELKQTINDLDISDEIKVSLLEDVEDSVDVSDETEKVEKTAYDELETKYNELMTKYKERFLKSDEKEDEVEEKEDEVEEKEVIDIKEI